MNKGWILSIIGVSSHVEFSVCFGVFSVFRSVQCGGEYDLIKAMQFLQSGPLSLLPFLTFLHLLYSLRLLASFKIIQDVPNHKGFFTTRIDIVLSAPLLQISNIVQVSQLIGCYSFLNIPID